MAPALCVLAGRTLEGDVGAAVAAHFHELAGDGLAALERRVIERLDVGVLFLDILQAPVAVDQDDLGCTVEEGKVGGHLADGTGAPDGDDVALIDARVDYAVPRGGEDIREEETLLVGHVVGERKQVDVAVGHTGEFGLATGEAASEVRVAKHACCAAAVHGVLDGV